MTRVKIGIIGGSGLDDPDFFSNRKEIYVSTPFGKPSDCLVIGQIGGVDCILLARHGRNHSLSPSNVNYRANIWALKEQGCTHIIASTAVGSLKEEIHPGDLVVLSSFIDRTYKRQQTFYDGQDDSPTGVVHLPMEPAFCNKTRDIITSTIKELGFPFHKNGTCITIEGPRFSSKAESILFKSWGADVINMTTVPEVVLAKEAGICYVAVALATDYCCWRESEKSVCVAEVLKTFKQNVSKICELFHAVIPKIAVIDWTIDIADLKATVEGSFQSK